MARLGMFGARSSVFASPYGTPPYAPVQTDFDPLQGQVGALPVPATPAAKPGFFDRDGLGVSLLGNLADGVLSLNGMKPTFGPTQDAQRKARQDQLDYERDRQDRLADWTAQQEYKAAHPDAAPAKYFEANNGDQYVIDSATGQPRLVYHDPTPKTTYTPVKNADGTTTIYPTVNGQVVGAQATGSAALPEGFKVRPKGGAATQPGTFRSAFDAVIDQESGGRAGVVGPQTKYGRAVGMTQLLPATAKEQAERLGVPWRPDLLSATTPQGAEYQRALGESYFSEGYRKTGNLTDALHYYHGGPDRRLWGPKTRSYAQSVLARMKG